MVRVILLRKLERCEAKKDETGIPDKEGSSYVGTGISYAESG